jgi:cytochrome P450 PksS
MTTFAPRIDQTFLAPRLKANPFPNYAQWRERHPVCRMKLLTGEDAHLAFRYADVAQLLKHPGLAKDPGNALTPDQLRTVRQPPRFFAMLQQNMLALDDPDHARLKRLVTMTFVPRRVEELKQETARVSAQLLDRLPHGASFDLMRDYANPLPVRVICELLGVPLADQQPFARWSNALIEAGAGGLAAVKARPAIVRFMRYLRQLVAMKRAVPDDRLVSAMIAAEQDDGKLDGDELLAMIAILLSAGHETTQNLIGNGILALTDHPDQRDALAANPCLMPGAIEELLRFAGPVETSTYRYAREDLEIWRRRHSPRRTGARRDRSGQS